MNKQGKSNSMLIIVLVIAAVVAGYFLISGSNNGGDNNGSYSMTRTGPTTATGTFTLTYMVTGTGTWGASIIDTATGGCIFPDGTNQLKTVMLSPDGNSKQITVTAPSSGSCTFTGDYKFETNAIVNFPGKTVTIQ